jgi:RimJ/RimL family protein N-acetyltransferase
LNWPTDCDLTRIAFESAGLYLRALCADDAQLYCDLFADPGTMRYIGSTLPRELAADHFRKALASMHRRPPRAFYLTIGTTALSRHCGICSVQNFDARDRSAELGMMLRSAEQMRGRGQQALRALIDITFQVFAVDEVWLQSLIEHSVAERAALGVGFLPSNRVQPTAAGKHRRSWSVYRRSWPAPQGLCPSKILPPAQAGHPD